MADVIESLAQSKKYVFCREMKMKNLIRTRLFIKSVIVSCILALFFHHAVAQSCTAELNLNDTTVCKTGTFNLILKNIDTIIKTNLLPRNAGNAVYLNGKVYLAGGDDGAGNLTPMEILDLSNYQVSIGAPLPNHRSELGLAVANNKIYAIGGYNGGATNYVDEYDPINNTWTAKASMPTARSVFCAATVNNIIYCAGGWPGSINKMEAYDPASNSWTTKANMPTPIQNFNSMSAVNGKLYFIGGRNAMSSVIYDLVYEYNPQTDVWSQKTSLPAPRYSGTAVTDGAEIYYLGGSSTTNIYTSGTNTIFIYNPATNAWQQSSSTMPTTRTRHSAVYANGKLWVFSGLDSSGKVITDIWNNNYLNYAIRWSTGDTTRSIAVSPTLTTTYWGEFYNNNSSCRDSVTITIENPRLAIKYPDKFGNIGNTVALTARPFGQNYLWIPATGLSSATISNPMLVLSNDQMYTVRITTQTGCVTIDTQWVKIKIDSEEKVFVPNAFTPNMDGLNDFFKPTLCGIKELAYFRIYSRWGELIYETKDITNLIGWDGKYKTIIQPNGVYIWTMECKGNSGKRYTKKGTLTLIR